MKNFHDDKNYEKVEPTANETEPNVATQNAENTPEKRKAKKKPTGAYFYVHTDADKLKEAAFARTMLTIIAFMLQVVVLAMPQGGLEYITNNIPSYAYAYMWIVFVMIGVSVWLFVMNAVRYKIVKRIPVERAPKKGFKRRAYFGAELYIAVNALLFVIELSFVCIHYDGFGLASMFLCLLAVGAAVGARMVTWLALRNSERVESE